MFLLDILHFIGTNYLIILSIRFGLWRCLWTVKIEIKHTQLGKATDTHTQHNYTHNNFTNNSYYKIILPVVQQKMILWSSRDICSILVASAQCERKSGNINVDFLVLWVFQGFISKNATQRGKITAKYSSRPINTVFCLTHLYKIISHHINNFIHYLTLSLFGYHDCF